MIDLIQRRRAMMGVSEPPYLDGWVIGYRQSGNGDAIYPDADFIRSPFLHIPIDCQKIYIYHPITITIGNRLRFYDGDEEYLNMSPQYANNSTAYFNVISGSIYIRVSFMVECIDDCYIQDVTHNQYIWKGKNV